MRGLLVPERFDGVAAGGPREGDFPGPPPGREGVAAAAVSLRWGSYLAVLADRGKPLWRAVREHSLSRISDDEMARINIEASAAMAERIPCRGRPRG